MTETTSTTPVTAPLTQREPALIIAVAAAALLEFLVLVGVHLTGDQIDGAVELILKLAPAVVLVQGWLTRRKVFSPATVADLTGATVQSPEL